MLAERQLIFWMTVEGARPGASEAGEKIGCVVRPPRSLLESNHGDLQLLRVLESHFPDTVETPEGPFKHIFDEGPREVLEAYRGAKRAIC